MSAGWGVWITRSPMSRRGPYSGWLRDQAGQPRRFQTRARAEIAARNAITRFRLTRDNGLVETEVRGFH